MLCGVRNDLHPSLEGLRIVSIAGLYAKKERGKCLSLFLGQRGTGTNPSKSDLPVAGQSRGLDRANPLFAPLVQTKTSQVTSSRKTANPLGSAVFYL